jgi:hypothetical protein
LVTAKKKSPLVEGRKHFLAFYACSASAARLWPQEADRQHARHRVHDGEQDIERSWRRRPGDWKSATLTMVAPKRTSTNPKKCPDQASMHSR